MDLRKERTLKLLSESLMKLLHEKSYASITVSEVCEGAMVRRATFYRHFGGKDDLFAYAVTARRSQLDAQIDPHGTLPLPEYCRRMTSEFLRLVSGHHAILAARALTPEFAFMKSLLANELGKRFAQKLAERAGQDEPSPRVQELAAFYANGLVGIVEQHVKTQGEENSEELLALIDEIAQRLFPQEADVQNTPAEGSESNPDGRQAQQQ
ncbi:MAG: TetR/AcrR family transcriptional regulator [Eggerthellaceae bacterium]|jgi:AcrR family transcriptional regulator